VSDAARVSFSAFPPARPSSRHRGTKTASGPRRVSPPLP